ncbi:MAG: hypothetical protein ACOCTT_02110 [archaeon]
MVFRFTEALQLIKIENLIALISSGIILAVTIMVTHYLHIKQGKRNIAIASVAATFISTIILFPIFDNKEIFISMMMFYLAGLITLIYLSKINRKKGVLRDLSLGWSLSKKMIYLLAIGGLIVPLLITSATLEQRQAQFKESMTNVTESQIDEIDMGEIIDPEEIDMGITSENITKEEFKEDILLPQIKMTGMPMNYSTWEDMSEEEKEITVDYLYQQFMEEQEGMDGAMEDALSKAIEQQIEDMDMDLTESIMDEMFEKIPIFNLTLKLLPLVTALIVSSLIITYGMMFIYPFCALMSPLLPLNGDEEEKNGSKEKDKE